MQFSTAVLPFGYRFEAGLGRCQATSGLATSTSTHLNLSTPGTTERKAPRLNVAPASLSSCLNLALPEMSRDKNSSKQHSGRRVEMRRGFTAFNCKPIQQYQVPVQQYQVPVQEYQVPVQQYQVTVQHFRTFIAARGQKVPG